MRVLLDVQLTGQTTGPDGHHPVPPEPDYAGAVQYALDRAQAGLAARLTYHNVSHTRDDVLPAVRRLAALSGLDRPDTGLLEVAAAYHDLGYVVFYAEHEQAGIDVMLPVLPGFGFSGDQIRIIERLILATEVPQCPQTLLEAIMADADLDALGREDFLEHSLALQAERAAMGAPLADADWYREQVFFLRSHRYFTEAARSLRVEGQRRNLARVEAKLAELEAGVDGEEPASSGLDWLIKP
jgi:uncharacterized protein